MFADEVTHAWRSCRECLDDDACDYLGRAPVLLALAGARHAAWIGLAAFAAHLAWQISRLQIDDPALCLRLFKSNRDAGLLLFAGLLIDAVVRAG